MAPTLERSRAVSATRAHLDRGFRFEQAGALERALEAYRDALAVATDRTDEIESRLRIARTYRGMAAWLDSRRESAEAIRLANEIGADDLAAEAMNVEIGALQVRGFFEDAEEMALAAITRGQSPRVRGITLQNLGRGAAELLDILLTTVQNQASVLVATGDLEAAEMLLKEALGHFTSANNLGRQAECLEIMGTLSERRPDFDTAARCYVRARDLATTTGDRPLIGRLTTRLDAIALVRNAIAGRAD